jgi:hypothetical protein
MAKGIRSRWVFAATAPICGFAYWWFRDWWVYVDFPESPMPKFELPWWWQAIESAAVGAIAGGLLAGAWSLFWGVYLRLTEATSMAD